MILGENVTDKKVIRTFNKLPERLYKKHKDRFDYSKVVFTGMKNKVIIICKEHGEFLQNMELHLDTLYGCSKCSRKYRKNATSKITLNVFLDRVNEAQNNNYDTSNILQVTTMRQKYEFTCKKHNVNFIQIGSDAMAGKTGCNICKGEKIFLANSKSPELWLQQAINKHGNKFDYSQAIYLGDKHKVKIICPTHGVFEQAAGQHLVYGCDKCARDAVNTERYKDTPTLFYTFKYKGLYKIDITTKATTEKRYYKDIDDWDNVTELIEVMCTNFGEAYLFEQYLINKYQEYRYFGKKIFKNTGITEVFTENIYEIYLKETSDGK